MKKNIGTLVCAIIGTVFGVISAILWAACADLANSIDSATGGSGNAATLYLALFLILGLGGSVLSLIGGIQAFNYKKAGLVLSVIGLLMQLGMIIVECVSVGGFSFLLTFITIIALVLFLVATILAGVKKAPVENNASEHTEE